MMMNEAASHDVDADGFCKVTNKRRRRTRARPAQRRSTNRVPDTSDGDVPLTSTAINRFMGQLARKVKDVEHIAQQAMDCIAMAVPAVHVKCVVLYGIGRFAMHKAAAYQLALAVAIREKLERDFGGAASMLLFDPAFTAQEKSIAEALEGAELIEENEHCARAAHSPTVFLMPHMLSEFYVNLIGRNRTPDTLRNVILIGNNLRSLETNAMHTSKRRAIEAIIEVLPRATLHPLPPFEQCERAFNDVAIHLFDLMPQDQRTLPSDANDSERG